MSFLMRVMAAAVAAMTLSTVGMAQPLVVQQGQDFWQTTSAAFSAPIPAGFFAPGSDPFTGSINFNGRPLDPALSNADTVVQRTAPVNFAGFPQVGTVPIQIVGLSLRSVNPIMVTYNGGMNAEPWDVRVELAPPPSTGGGMQLNRTAANGGTFQSAFQVQPRFVFTRVSDGLSRQLAPGNYNAASIVPGPWQTTPTTPPGVPAIPGWGPNFFAGPASHMINGPTYTQTMVRAQGADCNRDGIIDALNLQEGTSLDSNMNRTPDECEMTLSCKQLSFANDVGGYAARYSAWGELGVRAVEPPAGTVLWFNATIAGVWKVQNMPIIEIDGQGGFHTYLVPFDLGATGPMAPTPVIGKLSTTQQTVAPTGTAAVVPIVELNYRVGGRGPATSPLLPGTAINFINPATVFLWREEHRAGVRGVAEAKDGCAPGSGARSLDWMNNTYCLGFPADCDTPQELYAKLFMLMGTTSPGGTSDANNVAGLRALILSKMLQNALTVTLCVPATPADVAAAVGSGADVMGLIGWTGPGRGGHVITITGVTVCGPFTTIHYRDDAQCDTTADTSDTKTALLIGGTLVGLAPNTFDGIIKITPSILQQITSLLKWVSGDAGSGGSVAGIGPLLDTGILAGGLTSAQLANLKKWLANARLIGRYLLAQLQADPNTPPAILAAAQRIKDDLDAAYAAVLAYMASLDPIFLASARARLDPAFFGDQQAIDTYRDCNNNNIDDAADVANGVLHDANHDGRYDECQCLADWNSDGVRNVTDIFAFLRSWFAGDADFNHDGVSNVADIFAFLSRWFAGCP